MADHLTEEQQVEAIKNWWKENGVAVIAGVVIGIALLFGWRYWQEHKETQAGEASALYGEFQLGLKANNKDAMAASRDKLFADYASTPYASLTALAIAKTAVDENNTKIAKENLEWVLANAKQEQIKQTARTRLIALHISDAEYDAAQALLPAQDATGYVGVYEELRGDILLAKGDRAGANAAYDKALQSDGLSPASREMLNMKFVDTNPVTTSKAETVK